MTHPRLAAALLASAASLIGAATASAEVPLERVQWQPDFGQPSAGLLAGRAEYVLLFSSGDATASGAFNRFSYYLHHDYAGDVGIAALAIGVEANFGVASEKEVERFARGTDDGGLLRAFAGERTGVMLVCDPTGRLIELRDIGAIDDTWLHTLRKLAEQATPLIDEGAIPGAMRPAMPWFLVGDMKRFGAAAAKIPGSDATLRALAKKAAELADADAKVVDDATASASTRLLALLRMQALAVDFPNTAAATQKTLKSVKDDAAIKAEQLAWGAFLDYVAQMRKLRGKAGAEAQKPLLAALLAKHPGTYAAELVGRIVAYAKLELPAPKEAK